MSTLPFSRLRKFIVTLALVIFAGGIGYRLGQQRIKLSVTADRRVIVNQNPPATAQNIDFGLFWDVWQRMFRYYIDSASLDPQKMVWGAISGMVSAAGDPYTAFLPPKENQEFKEDLGGAFEGIGAQLGMKDNRIIVIAPLKDTPAERAGIRPGDWIVKVNGEETNGWTVPQAVVKIRGPRGSIVTLAILHENGQKPIDVRLVRETIAVPSVEDWVKSVAEIKEISGLESVKPLLRESGQVAYLRLSRFGDRTNEDWQKAVADVLRAQRGGGVRGLVLDLRNNPGGYLDGSVYIASEFLSGGVVVSQVNSDGSKQDYSVNRRGALLDIPLIVLVNKGSASASEILAGALRDHKRAKLVGEVTFGKGSVQTPQELAGGAGLHVTTGKWLLPSGESINKKGVTPGIEVKLADLEASRDAQLAKAIELLLK